MNGGGWKTQEARPSRGGRASEIVFQVPEAGVTQTEFEQGNRALSESGGTPGGTVGPDLQIVIQAWHSLSETTKRKILRDVQRSLK